MLCVFALVCSKKVPKLARAQTQRNYLHVASRAIIKIDTQLTSNANSANSIFVVNPLLICS